MNTGNVVDNLFGAFQFKRYLYNFFNIILAIMMFVVIISGPELINFFVPEASGDIPAMWKSVYGLIMVMLFFFSFKLRSKLFKGGKDWMDGYFISYDKVLSDQRVCMALPLVGKSDFEGKVNFEVEDGKITNMELDVLTLSPTDPLTQMWSRQRMELLNSSRKAPSSVEKEVKQEAVSAPVSAQAQAPISAPAAASAPAPAPKVAPVEDLQMPAGVVGASS